MVVSGLPKPNEGRHIAEISSMALDLLRLNGSRSYDITLRHNVMFVTSVTNAIGVSYSY